MSAVHGTAPQRLDRQNYADATGLSTVRAPVRMVHLGLGAFHRAHQAWFTSAVDTANEWGIAAFTGRDPAVAAALTAQDGLFTLVVRGEDEDLAQVIGSIVEAHDGADVERLAELVSSADVALVTLTITEAGYRLGDDGLPDRDDAMVAYDIAALHGISTPKPGDALVQAPPLQTALGRLTYGLLRRWSSGSGPIAVVPCDNLPHNGPLVRTAVLSLASEVSIEFATWLDATVSFVSTSVDRITPKITPQDIAEAAAATGWADSSVVVSEPFVDWILSGSFPAGRPSWEDAGARFVDDIEPFERRKLWLLNGAHSLLAYTAPQRGHQTIAAAIADPHCRSHVEDFWAEAVRHLPADLDLTAYTRSLLTRFGNARIEHRLGQIGMEAVTKLRVRIAPIALAEAAAGRSGDAAARVIAGWIDQVDSGAAPADSASERIRALESLDREQRVRGLLAIIDPRLPDAPEIVSRCLAGNALPS